MFVTRLQVQYDPVTIQYDLLFRETIDRENFQWRYIMFQRFTGESTCQAGRDYVSQKRT